MSRIFTILCFVLFLNPQFSFSQCDPVTCNGGNTCSAANTTAFVTTCSGDDCINVSASFTLGSNVDISSKVITLNNGRKLTINNGTTVTVDCRTRFFFANNGSELIAYGISIGTNNNTVSETDLNNALQALGDGNTSDLATVLGLLPVNLKNFSGKYQSDYIALAWQTEGELNNDYFEVQHSTDAKTFRPLKKIAGAGTTDELQAYEFTHHDFAKGVNYYRLKQVDYDGAFEYSGMVVVRTPLHEIINVFPSFVQSELRYLLKESATSDTRWQIVDINGKVWQQQIIGAGTSEGQIDVSDLPQGHYFLRLAEAEEAFSVRFFKLP